MMAKQRKPAGVASARRAMRSHVAEIRVSFDMAVTPAQARILIAGALKGSEHFTNEPCGKDGEWLDTRMVVRSARLARSDAAVRTESKASVWAGTTAIDEAEWWTHYQAGKLIRHARTPSEIVSTLDDWFDGANSAMRRFVRGEAVSAHMLLREIDKCVLANRLEKEVPRLHVLQKWAAQESRVAHSAVTLRKAKESFDRAVEQAALDPYYADLIRRSL